MKTTELIFAAFTLTLLTTHAVLGQTTHTAKTSQAKPKASDAGNAEKQAQDILMRLTTIMHPENDVRVGEPDWAQRRWRAQRVTGDAMNSAAAQLELLGSSIAPFLARNLDSSSPDVGRACSTALAHMGVSAIPYLMDSLKQRGATPYVAMTLRMIGEDAIPSLLEVLKNGQDLQRLAAAQALEDFFPQNRNMIRSPNEDRFVLSTSAIQVICQRVSVEQNVSVRKALVKLLGKIGPQNQLLVSAVSGVARHDTEPSVRLAAFDDLSSYASEQTEAAAKETVDTLVQCLLHDDSDDLRADAANILGRLDKADSARVAGLTAALKDRNSKVVLAAINALTSVGNKATAALPELNRILEQDANDKQFAVSALNAIAKISDAKSSLQVIRAHLSSSNQQVKLAAVRSLANFKTDAAPAIPDLIPMLDDSNVSLRYIVIETLASIGANSKEVENALRRDMDKYDGQDCHYVQRALKKMGVVSAGTSAHPTINSDSPPSASPDRPPVTARSHTFDNNNAPYMADLQRRIKRAWFPPRGQENKKVVVKFKLHQEGNLSDLQLVTPSGSDSADTAAMNAVRNAAPFRHLPAGASDEMGVEFTFDYNVFSGGGGARITNF